MSRKSLKFLFAIVSVVVFSHASWALEPTDALSARPAKSIYTVWRLDNLNGLLQSVFSPSNIEMLASLGSPSEAQGVRLAASLVTQIPAKSVAVAVGMTSDKSDPVFLQAAASMPPSVRPKLDSIAQGTASGVDLITLLVGEGGLLFAAGVEPTLQKGAKGPYYALGPVVFAAKEDLLLTASSLKHLEASLSALEKADSRLAFKRWFKSPNYYTFHIDPTVLTEFMDIDKEAASALKDYDVKALTALYKAPLDMEVAFDSKPGSFLMSGGMNAMEAFAFADRLKDIKPASGNLFLAGGGKAYFVFSYPMDFKVADWRVFPEFAKKMDPFFKELAKRGISEKDVEELLTGSASLVLGSDATILGRKTPGGYLAMTGQKGAASKILKKITEDEQISQALPLAPLKAEGWDTLFRVDPKVVPLPLIVGVSGDTLFLGVADPDGLNKKPELPAEGDKLFKEALIGGGFFDAGAVWEHLRREVADPSSPAAFLMPDEATQALVKDFLSAELSIPFVKLWAPSLETSFMEFTVTDVPQGKRLLPKLLTLSKQMDKIINFDADDEEGYDEEEEDFEVK